MPIDGEGEGSDTDALRTMLEPLEDLDIDSFLTPDTFNWCQQQLLDLGFTGDQSTELDPMRPFFQVYLQMRERVREHIDQGNTGPVLALTSAPKGGVKEYVSIRREVN